MNEIIQAATVLAAFAAAHERLIELVRSTNDRLSASFRPWERLGAWIDRNTIGPGNVVIAVGMAFATQANLLALFHASKSSPQQVLFFDLFMNGGDWLNHDFGLSKLALVAGFILMGLTTALGSQFWHDFAFGLVDVRQRVQAVSAQTAPQAAPQKVAAQPSRQFVVVAGGGGDPLTPVIAPVGPKPNPSPPAGVFVAT
jgi:hypothetical protein